MCQGPVGNILLVHQTSKNYDSLLHKIVYLSKAYKLQANDQKEVSYNQVLPSVCLTVCGEGYGISRYGGWVEDIMVHEEMACGLEREAVACRV